MAELDKPFGDGWQPVSGFRKNVDYRKSDSWQALLKSKPAMAESCVQHARAWIECVESDGRAPDLPAESLYETALRSQEIKVNSDHPHAYTSAYHTLRGLSEAIQSHTIEVGDRSKIHAAVGELHTSEVRNILEIRNAALQQARVEIDQDKAENKGRAR